MNYTYQRRRWPAYLLLAFCLALSFTPVLAAAPLVEEEPEQSETDETNKRLLQHKESDWRITRALANLTEPPDADFMPTTDTPPFTRRQDGKVVWLTEVYDRYVKVTSAAELTTALAQAHPGDFIHLQDGSYQGNFTIKQSGLEQKRIALVGSRRAVLDGQGKKQTYGLHLQADYWSIFGFTIRNAGKGLVADGANHNLFHSLEIYQIGDEGLHLRKLSSHNRIEKVWIHDVGLVNPEFGEGIYIGSAVSNWPTYTDDQPDRSDYNEVISNVLGPHLTAEGVDIKEGTQGGIVHNNTFLTDDELVADSWIDVKGNDYTISRNLGLYEKGSEFRIVASVHKLVDGWGENNRIQDNQLFETKRLPGVPFFATEEDSDSSVPSFSQRAYLLLPARSLPYTLSELAVYFPDAFPTVAANTLLVRENILLQNEAAMRITTDDASQVQLLSSPAGFATITGFNGQITIAGTPTQRLDFTAWDEASAAADQERNDGRAYVLAMGGRMDIAYAGFFALGYEEGTVSGVAWKSLIIDDETIIGRGDVRDSHFVRNYFGAYTFEAVGMHWTGNTFAENIKYGFDPHDFSNEFLFEENVAHDNGSHGIIFSRGCDDNLIRRNKSFDNLGHGIMIDDGKVVPGSENERHLTAVPSNDNVIEDNFVVNNHDGIVLEGGEGNIVRNNMIMGPHRYGVRLKDAVSAAQVISNTIEQSEHFAIFVYNQATHNRLEHNTINRGGGGIALQDSSHNTVQANTIKGSRGAALMLKGNVAESVIADNEVSGFGAHPFQTTEMTGLSIDQVWAGNDFSRWRYLLPSLVPSLLIGTWGLIFLVPLVMTARRTITNRLFPKRGRTLQR